MAAVHYNIPEPDAILIGEDGTIRVLITDDGLTTGTPVNCTGFALSFIIQVPESGTTVVTKATGGSGVTIANGDATGDAIDIAYLVADTLDLRDGIYDYALWRTDSGERRRLAWGTVPIRDAALLTA